MFKVERVFIKFANSPNGHHIWIRLPRILTESCTTQWHLYILLQLDISSSKCQKTNLASFERCYKSTWVAATHMASFGISERVRMILKSESDIPNPTTTCPGTYHALFEPWVYRQLNCWQFQIWNFISFKYLFWPMSNMFVLTDRATSLATAHT